MNGKRWSDLSADVLREISSRLWEATDFIYFHAVCKPWRNSRDPPLQGTTTTQFLPWLLEPAQKYPADLKFRCVFSNASYRATAASPVPWRNWVCRADGAAYWYLTVENLRPSLHDPLTGEVTHLPPLPYRIGEWDKEIPCGVVYRDGSTLLYRIFRVVGSGVHIVRFMAALLNPGDTEWIIVDRTFQAEGYSGQLYAGYHDGKIMVTESGLWHAITPDDHNVVAVDVLVPKPLYNAWEKHAYWSRQYNYLLESRGELLWALVKVYIHHNAHRYHHRLSLSVHALEQDDSATEKTMRWVRKTGRSMAGRVLFLGCPNSFVVDASRLRGEDRACAYLAYSGPEGIPREQSDKVLTSHNSTLILVAPGTDWEEADSSRTRAADAGSHGSNY
ncbi:hypothetical protein ACQ4PT_014339 [Festuca glaucescens]